MLRDAAGEVTIEVLRDRAGTFAPVVVKKRQRRLNDVDAIAISLYAKGLTTGEIAAHFAEVYSERLQRHHQPDHRQVRRWDAVLSSRPLRRVRGDLHRRDLRQGPGRAGLQPAVLRRDRGRPDGHRMCSWAGNGSGESAKF